MNNHLDIYTLFLVLVFCFSVKGQNKTDLTKQATRPDVKQVNTSHGPNQITRNIIQDKKGNIWVASWEGVFKYDGNSFTNITSKVSSARFFSVFEDSRGHLWFGSIGLGVYEYDGKSFRNFTTKDGLAGNSVTCIYEDRTGNIWFGTANGTSRYNGKSFRNFKTREASAVTQSDSMHVSAYQHPLSKVRGIHNDVNAIIGDKTGKLWFGTRGYASVYNGKTFTVITNKNGKPFANVRSIIKDKKGNIWLGGYDGLWRYNGTTFTNFSQSFVGFIYEDRKGNIWTSSKRDDNTWVLSAYDGKYLSDQYSALYRSDSESPFDKKPVKKEITTKDGMFCGILEANDGSIWFCANDGVYRYNGNSIVHY